MVKIKITQFVDDLLRYQSAFDINLPASCSFHHSDNKSYDSIEHDYIIKRIVNIGEKKMFFTLTQDGKNLDYPNEKISNFHGIMKCIIEIYEHLNYNEYKKFIHWRSFIDQIRFVKLDFLPELEKLSSWIEGIEHLGLFSKRDIMDIVLHEFPDENQKSIRDKYIVKKEGYIPYSINHIIEDDYRNTVIERHLEKSERDYDPNKKNKLKKYFTDYLSRELIKIYSPQLPRKEDPTPFYNERDFITTLDHVQSKLRNNNDFVLPLVNTTTSPNKEDMFIFFTEQIKKYNKSFEPKEKWSEFAWLIDASIGMGKTTFVEVLFKKFAHKYLHNETNLVPLLISGKNIQSKTIRGLLTDEFQQHEDFFKAKRNSCSKQKAKMLLIIDGIDEIKFPLTRIAILDLCAQFVHDSIFVILTSRTNFELQEVIKNKISSINIGTISYPEKYFLSQLGLPDNVNVDDKVYLFNFFFQRDRIEEIFFSPMFFSIARNLFRFKDSTNKLIKADFSLKLHKIFTQYYNKLLQYSRNKGNTFENYTYNDLISNCTEIAIKIYKDEPLTTSDVKFEFVKNIGLMSGSLEKPHFIHELFFYDFLARDIQSSSGILNAQEIFDIIFKDDPQQFSVGFHAIQMAINNSSITHKKFDLFGLLPDDISLRFSRLKLEVLQARNKKLSPFNNECWNSYLSLKRNIKTLKENDNSSQMREKLDDLKQKLQKMHIHNEKVEQDLISLGDLDLLKDIGISSQNIDGFLSFIYETPYQDLNRNHTINEYISAKIFYPLVKRSIEENQFDLLIKLYSKLPIKPVNCLILRLIDPIFTQKFLHALLFKISESNISDYIQISYRNISKYCYDLILFEEIKKNERLIVEIIKLITSIPEIWNFEFIEHFMDYYFDNHFSLQRYKSEDLMQFFDVLKTFFSSETLLYFNVHPKNAKFIVDYNIHEKISWKVESWFYFLMKSFDLRISFINLYNDLEILLHIPSEKLKGKISKNQESEINYLLGMKISGILKEKKLFKSYLLNDENYRIKSKFFRDPCLFYRLPLYIEAQDINEYNLLKEKEIEEYQIILSSRAKDQLITFYLNSILNGSLFEGNLEFELNRCKNLLIKDKSLKSGGGFNFYWGLYIFENFPSEFKPFMTKILHSEEKFEEFIKIFQEDPKIPEFTSAFERIVEILLENYIILFEKIDEVKRILLPTIKKQNSNIFTDDTQKYIMESTRTLSDYNFGDIRDLSRGHMILYTEKFGLKPKNNQIEHILEQIEEKFFSSLSEIKKKSHYAPFPIDLKYILDYFPHFAISSVLVQRILDNEKYCLIILGLDRYVSYHPTFQALYWKIYERYPEFLIQKSLYSSHNLNDPDFAEKYSKIFLSKIGEIKNSFIDLNKSNTFNFSYVLFWKFPLQVWQKFLLQDEFIEMMILADEFDSDKIRNDLLYRGFTPQQHKVINRVIEDLVRKYQTKPDILLNLENIMQDFCPHMPIIWNKTILEDQKEVFKKLGAIGIKLENYFPMDLDE